MVYPFPRSPITAQTPHHLLGIENSRDAPCRKDKPLVAYKRTAVIVVIITLVLLWMISPFSTSSNQNDRIPLSHDAIEDYFTHFEGHQDCGITSKDLYIPPATVEADDHRVHPYCKNRATLLEAMSGGGRHGFEAPFYPAGCHYRWYSTTEICMILERFDALVFIGDGMLQHIYAAFNMLLRENIAMGSLKQWEMKESERVACRCDNQIIRFDCFNYAAKSSQVVANNDGGSGHKSPYYCDRIPHVFLSIGGSPAPETLHAEFSAILSKDSGLYKPVPVIHSLSVATSLSWPMATASMDEWIGLADASMRKSPFLWIGPNAAGHLKPPGQILSQGNNALWHYTVEMAKEAKSRDVDALGMYNLTLQAASWDGSSYGQRVALVQAMMVINWLSRLETS